MKCFFLSLSLLFLTLISSTSFADQIFLMPNTGSAIILDLLDTRTGTNSFWAAEHRSTSLAMAATHRDRYSEEAPRFFLIQPTCGLTARPWSSVFLKLCRSSSGPLLPSLPTAGILQSLGRSVSLRQESASPPGRPFNSGDKEVESYPFTLIPGLASTIPAPSFKPPSQAL